MDRQRISSYLNQEIIKEIDEVALYHGMSRSAAISVLITLAVAELQRSSDLFKTLSEKKEGGGSYT